MVKYNTTIKKKNTKMIDSSINKQINMWAAIFISSTWPTDIAMSKGNGIVQQQKEN